VSDTIVLAEFNSRLEADMAANLLAGYDIPSRVEGDDLGGLGPAQSLIDGVRLIVNNEDEAQAREILAGSGR